MLNYLKQFNEEMNGKVIEHPELAFSPDGIDELNKRLIELNGGKFHQPIYKVRTFEPKGTKCNIGQTGNKRKKFAEAAKGTNLFFAIYQDENGNRNYETVPLNIVMGREHLSPVPETNASGHQLLFFLSPNDLVYIPDADETENKGSINLYTLTKQQVGRVYKVVSFTGARLYCIPHTVSISIVDKVEFTQLNKLEFTPEKLSIKEVCLKLKTDRLGNIKSALKSPKLPTKTVK
jgi:CRISPR-associated endonuclease Csn1